MVATVQTKGDSIEVAPPRELFRYSGSADGASGEHDRLQDLLTELIDRDLFVLVRQKHAAVIVGGDRRGLALRVLTSLHRIRMA
jgi:hypothetical protein